MKRTTLTLLIALAMAHAASAQTFGDRKFFYVRASLGYGAQSLGQLNDAIRRQEEILKSAGLPVEWETFGGALDLGGELGITLLPVLSIGIGVNHQRNEVRNSYSDLSGSLSDDLKLTIWEVTSNVTLWAPGVRGLFFGGNAGFGIADWTSLTILRVVNDPSADFTLKVQANGSNFVGGLFAGYEMNFAAGPLVFGKIGYRFRRIGEFEGTAQTPEFGGIPGRVLDPSGQPISFDFSGFYVFVGFGISVGKEVERSSGETG
jgi:hypothetical protein